MADYLHRKFMTEREKEFFVNLINLCPLGFAVFPKIKLAELVKPASDFGSDSFISKFKLLNKITLDFAIFDLNGNYTISIIDFQEADSASNEKSNSLMPLAESLGINYFYLTKISDLYIVDVFKKLGASS